MKIELQFDMLDKKLFGKLNLALHARMWRVEDDYTEEERRYKQMHAVNNARNKFFPDGEPLTNIL